MLACGRCRTTRAKKIGGAIASTPAVRSAAYFFLAAFFFAAFFTVFFFFAAFFFFAILPPVGRFACRAQ